MSQMTGFWIMVTLSIVLIVMMCKFTFSFACDHSRGPAAGTVSIALFFCISLAVLLWPYSRCPECDNRLPNWYSSSCENCGAYFKDLPYCPRCHEEVDKVILGECVNCGSKVIYNWDETLEPTDNTQLE